MKVPRISTSQQARLSCPYVRIDELNASCNDCSQEHCLQQRKIRYGVRIRPQCLAQQLQIANEQTITPPTLVHTPTLDDAFQLEIKAKAIITSLFESLLTVKQTLEGRKLYPLTISQRQAITDRLNLTQLASQSKCVGDKLFLINESWEMNDAKGDLLVLVSNIVPNKQSLYIAAFE